MKRIISLILALTLCFSLATVASGSGHIPGFPDDQDPDPTKPECEHRNVRTEVVQAATCRKDGVQREVCADCGKVLTDNIKIPATGIHTPTEEWFVDEEGHHYQMCSGCGEIIEETVAEHTFEENKWQKDANNHWRVCTICGYMVDQAAHKWNSGKVTKAATCISKGTMTYTCTVCGATKTKELALTEHSWDGGNTTIQPTITEKGESTFKCIVCGKVATREIPPLGLSMTPEELLTVEAAPGNALNGRLDDENWVILQGTTTEEEYARIQGGWPITVTLKVTDITDTIGGELREAVQSAAGKKQKIHCFLQMELTKELYQDPAIPVPKTTEPIILSLTLPEELQEATSRRKERGFTVYRIDGDQPEQVVAQLSEDGQSLRLQTDTFGTYALTYLDRGGFEPIMLVYGAIGLLTAGGVGYLVYKIIKTLREEDEEDQPNEE